MNDKTNLTELTPFFMDIDTLQPVGVEYNRGFKSHKLITYEYDIKGNRAYVEREGSKWIGWFKDIQEGLEIVEKTKKATLISLYSYVY